MTPTRASAPVEDLVLDVGVGADRAGTQGALRLGRPVRRPGPLGGIRRERLALLVREPAERDECEQREHEPLQRVREVRALVADGAGAVATLEGQIKASVPLVGRKIEQLVHDQVAAALVIEQELGSSWLAD